MYIREPKRVTACLQLAILIFITKLTILDLVKLIHSLKIMFCINKHIESSQLQKSKRHKKHFYFGLDEQQISATHFYTTKINGTCISFNKPYLIQIRYYVHWLPCKWYRKLVSSRSISW